MENPSSSGSTSACSVRALRHWILFWAHWGLSGVLGLLWNTLPCAARQCILIKEPKTQIVESLKGRPIRGRSRKTPQYSLVFPNPPLGSRSNTEPNSCKTRIEALMTSSNFWPSVASRGSWPKLLVPKWEFSKLRGPNIKPK